MRTKTFISYAQNFEDVILWRALKKIKKGFYIDVGANNPNVENVTKAFYENGWSGINVEPISQWYKMLEKERPRDINLNTAVGNEKGEVILYEIPGTGLSTFSKEYAESYKAKEDLKVVNRNVPVTTLSDICDRYHSAPIHFLNIDVEGMESQVLQGMDFTKYRPWVILCEATIPNSQKANYKGWETILLNSDYKFVYFDGLNRYYIAKEHKKLSSSFKTPPNIFDGFLLSGYSQSLEKGIRLKNEIQELKAKGLERETSLTQNLKTQENLIESLKLKLEESDAKIAELNQSSHHWYLETGKEKEHSQALQAENERCEEQLKEQKEFNKKLSLELESSQALSLEFHQALRQLSKEKRHLQEEVDLDKQKIKSLEQLNQDIRISLAGYDELKQKHNELNNQCHHWFEAHNQANQSLLEMRQSFFWRATIPLRTLSGFVKRSLSWLKHKPKAMIKNVVFIMVSYLFRFPLFKGKLINFFSNNPELKNRFEKWVLQKPRLTAFFSEEGLVNPKAFQPASSIQSVQSERKLETTEPLNPTAKKIYTSLMNLEKDTI